MNYGQARAEKLAQRDRADTDRAAREAIDYDLDDISCSELALASEILYGGTVAGAERLDPRRMRKIRYRRMFEAALAIHGRGEPVTTLAVHDELAREKRLGEAGGVAFLGAVAQEGMTGNPKVIAAYAKAVSNAAYCRAAAVLARQVIEAADRGDIKEVAAAEQRLYGLVSRRADQRGGRDRGG